MKRTFLIMLALAALAGCTKSNNEESLSKSFTHTGCAGDTRGLETNDPSLLTLKHENGHLRVTCTNMIMSCAFKIRGLACKAYLEGDTIHYDVVYEKEMEGDVNCICRVEKMSSAVSGLEKGKQYTFCYNLLGTRFEPLTITFDGKLHKIYDMQTMRIYIDDNTLSD